MLTALALASSLWLAAAEAGARPDAAQAVVKPAAIPFEAIADDFANDLFWLVASHAADQYSTAWFELSCDDCVEGNPTGFSPEARAALKAGAVATTALICYKLRRGGHKNAAKVVRVVTAVANFSFAASNSYRAIRGRY